MRPALKILKGSGSACVPTSSFATLYRRLTRFLADVFPPEQNPQSQYPPASAAEFVSQRFAKAPEFHRHLACELWTLLREISEVGHKVNEKTLNDHQFAHLIWVTVSVTNGAESPTSFFIQGAPGTGKTLREAGIPVREIQKLHVGRPNLNDLVLNGEVVMIINTFTGDKLREDEQKIRRLAVQRQLPFVTTMAAAAATASALAAISGDRKMDVKPLQDYHRELANAR